MQREIWQRHQFVPIHCENVFEVHVMHLVHELRSHDHVFSILVSLVQEIYLLILVSWSKYHIGGTDIMPVVAGGEFLGPWVCLIVPFLLSFVARVF